MEFYILLAGVEIGPLTERQVRAYLHDGLISDADMVKHSGSGDWEPVTDLLYRLPAESIPPAVPPSPSETTPSPLDMLAAAEPAYPVLPSSAAPAEEAFPETSSLPRPSDFAPRASSAAKPKRKPSKIVIQPMTPLNVPSSPAKNETIEPPQDMAAPAQPVPTPATVPPRKKNGVSAKLATSQVEPSASSAAPRPAEPAPSPLPSVAPASTSAPTSRSRKRKSFWDKHLISLSTAAAFVLLVILPASAWLFFSSKSILPGASSTGLPTPATKDEEDVILASNPQTAEGLTKRATVRKNRNQIDTAVSDYNQAIRLDSKYVPAYYGRGLCRLTKGDWDNAMADFNQVLNLDPRHADAFNSRAYAEQNKGDLDAAVTDYTQALALDPKISRAYYNRGMIKLQRGDRSGAIEDFNSTLDLDKTMAYAFFNRGNAKNADGNIDGAIADYTQALNLNGNIPSAYSNRGFARQSKGDLDGAIADYTQALTLNANLPVAYYNRALARLSLGDLDGAIADSTKAIQLDPNDATSYCNRGLALFGKNHLNDAATDLQTFCQLAPTDPDTDAARLYLWLIATEQNPKGHANDNLGNALEDNWNSPPNELSATIARFLLDRVGESDIFAMADSSDPLQNEVRHGKAWYFAGMKRLINGDQATAVDAFRKVLQTDKKDFCEYVFAQTQLRALHQSFTAPPAPANPAPTPPPVSGN